MTGAQKFQRYEKVGSTSGVQGMSPSRMKYACCSPDLVSVRRSNSAPSEMQYNTVQ